jgi:hypothetical protein
VCVDRWRRIKLCETTKEEEEKEEKKGKTICWTNVVFP